MWEEAGLKKSERTETSVFIAVVGNWGIRGCGVLSAREVARAGHGNEGWGRYGHVAQESRLGYPSLGEGYAVRGQEAFRMSKVTCFQVTASPQWSCGPQWPAASKQMGGEAVSPAVGGRCPRIRHHRVG